MDNHVELVKCLKQELLAVVDSRLFDDCLVEAFQGIWCGVIFGLGDIGVQEVIVRTIPTLRVSKVILV